MHGAYQGQAAESGRRPGAEIVDPQLPRRAFRLQGRQGRRGGMGMEVLPMQATEQATLETYLEPGRYTSLVMPSDYDASFLLARAPRSLRRSGEMPLLLSFDNSPKFFHLPVTTVDFGFGYLGYAAFHLLMGDLPIPVKDGCVPARPAIIDRASVPVDS